jgi:hypothetical protein
MTEPDRLAAVFRAITGRGGVADHRRSLDDAVTGGLSVAPGVVGCSLTEAVGPRFVTTAYAGEPAIVLDRRQYDADVGPCVTAARAGERQIVDDIADYELSNPTLVSTAAGLGVHSVLSVPLSGVPKAAGINFYGARGAAFRDGKVLARAALLGRAVTILLVGRSAVAPPGQDQPTPARADTTAIRRDLVARARTTIADRDDITQAEAFAQLSARSKRECRSIFAVARDILPAPEVDGR